MSQQLKSGACPAAVKRAPAVSPPDKTQLVLSEIPSMWAKAHPKGLGRDSPQEGCSNLCWDTNRLALWFSLCGTQHVSLVRPERVFSKRMFETKLILALTYSFESERAQKNIHAGIAPLPSYKFLSKSPLRYLATYCNILSSDGYVRILKLRFYYLFFRYFIPFPE